MATAAGAEECLFLDFYSRGSEVTLGTFGVRFGRVFGTKLGGVLGWRGRVARGGELKPGAWQWQQRLEQKNVSFVEFFLGIQKSR